MALTRGKLADIQHISNTAGSVYANPASTKTYIRGFIVFNGSTSVQLFELWNIPDAAGSLGSTSAASKFLKMVLAAGETVVIPFPQPIVLTDTNDAIFAKVDTASVATIQILGDKE